MSGFLSRLAAAFGSAIMLMFFSEFYFVNEGPVAGLIDSLNSSPLLAIVDLAELAGFYLIFTYPFLMLLSYFKVRTLSGLLLAGAVFGWATEGLIVAVLYEAIPMSFIFPSIAWHGLIDVVIGWYLVRLAMRKFGVFGLALVFVVLGLFWGVWATWFWNSGDAGAALPFSPQDFGLMVLVVSIFWVIGMVLADRFGRGTFDVSRWEAGGVSLIVLVLFVATAFAFLPLSALIVPVIGVSIFALWRGRKDGSGETILARLHHTRPRYLSYVLVFLTPASAAFSYWLMFKTETQIPVEIVIWILVLVGSGWFAFALVSPFIARASSPGSSPGSRLRGGGA